MLIIGIARAWELVGDRATGIIASIAVLTGHDPTQIAPPASLPPEPIEANASAKPDHRQSEDYPESSPPRWREGQVGDSRQGRLAALLAGSLADRPLLCDLQAHASLSLEREVPFESARSYKTVALGAVETAGAAISRVLPQLTESDAHELVTAVTALAAMLWQYAHPAGSLRSLYEEDPWLAHAVVGFVPRLASMTQNLITGMLVHSQAEATAKTGKQDP